MLNSQESEKSIREPLSLGMSLDIVDIFPTIQGEGPYSGWPAIFIRLAGCNLKCPLCDTNYTEGRKNVAAMVIASEALALKETLWKGYEPESRGPRPLVVITGGEPFRQPIGMLIMYLLSHGFLVQIETNGTLYQDIPIASEVLIVCSPKTGVINENLKPHIGALKYVVKAKEVHPDDGLPLSALNHPVRACLARPWPEFKGPIYLTPCDENNLIINKLNIDAALKSCLKFGYIFNLQIHKIAGVK